MKRHFVTYNSIAAAVIGGAGVARLYIEMGIETGAESWGGNVVTIPYLQRETSASPTANGCDLGT